MNFMMLLCDALGYTMRIKCSSIAYPELGIENLMSCIASKGPQPRDRGVSV
jgi:hypothetical protein